MEENTKTKYNLDNVLIIPFLQAMKKGDNKVLKISKTEFEDLIFEYIEADKEKPNNFDKRINKIKEKQFIVIHTLRVLSAEPGDKEMMEVLRDQGYKMRWDYYFDDLDIILKDIKVMEFKIKNLENQKPKKLKKKAKSEKESIYAILTGVSSGLEMNLDYNNMVVAEFLEWKKVLSRKIEAHKKMKPKKSK